MRVRTTLEAATSAVLVVTLYNNRRSNRNLIYAFDYKLSLINIIIIYCC